MRLKTIAGVAFAGAAAAAVVAGGVAYASDGGGSGDQSVRIVYEDQNSGSRIAREDCPEKNGGAEQNGGGSGTPESTL